MDEMAVPSAARVRKERMWFINSISEPIAVV